MEDPFKRQIICPNCGAKNESGAKFCGECGTPLKVNRSEPPLADATNGEQHPGFQEELSKSQLSATGEAPHETVKTSKIKRRLLIILAATVAILCAVGGTYFYLNTGARLADKKITQGNKYLVASQYEKAISAFDDAIKADQQETDAYIGLASAYTALKNNQAAENSLKNGIKAAPKAETLYLKLAAVYENSGDDDTALQTLQNGYSALKTAKLKAELDSLNNKLNQSGISSGNLINAGLVAQNSGWFYYNDHGFYKVKTDGTGKTKLADDTALYINVVGDWIYYATMPSPGTYYLYKISTDGSGRTKLSSKEGLYPTVVGDWIYYIGVETTNNEIVLRKMKTDGSADTVLADHVSGYINVYNGWLYYWTVKSDGSHYDLCKMKTDGSSKTVLATGSEATAFNVSGDWLYYIDFATENSDQSIYKLHIDGTGKTQLNSDSVESINVQGDWIYYLVKNINGRIIYKMRTDGSDRTQLATNNDRTESSSLLNIVDSWIYYEDGNDAHPFKVRTDGSNKTNISRIGLSTGSSSDSQSGSSFPASSSSSSLSQIPSDAVSYNGHHYELFNNNTDWLEDKKYCEGLGGHLAVITSQKENNFLYKYIQSKDCDNAYFGAVRQGNDWKWVDGKTLSYANWADGEPNDQDDDECYGMFFYQYPDGTWNDGTGTDDYPFLCEWDK